MCMPDVPVRGQGRADRRRVSSDVAGHVIVLGEREREKANYKLQLCCRRRDDKVRLYGGTNAVQNTIRGGLFRFCVGTSGLDDDLDRAAAVHLVERELVVLELERVGDHALHLHLAAVEVSDRPREAECL